MHTYTPQTLVSQSRYVGTGSYSQNPQLSSNSFEVNIHVLPSNLCFSDLASESVRRAAPSGYRPELLPVPYVTTAPSSNES